jgi:aryl sulfotransferase
MRRISRFLEIDTAEDKWPAFVDAASFAGMKRDAALLGPEMGMVFEGGAERFLFKGTNDRWRDVLTDDDLSLYEAAATRTLTPELKRWLEQGASSRIVPSRAQH